MVLELPPNTLGFCHFFLKGPLRNYGVPVGVRLKTTKNKGMLQKKETGGPQVLVHVSILPGLAPFWGYPIFDPQPFGHGSKPRTSSEHPNPH